MAQGEVKIQQSKGSLRLVWRWDGQRYFLYTRLSDTPLNRLVCEAKAKQIEGDCVTGNFDATLRKYKDTTGNSDRTPAHELFQSFMNWKAKRVYARTLEKYEGLRIKLKDYFKNKAARAIKERDAEKFQAWLIDDQDLALLTVKERIGLLNACWNWAARDGMVTENPWADIKIRVPPKPKPKPFTRDEVNRILEAFRSGRYRHYSDYVEFLFSTGVRTGEAIGLRWEHVSDDCAQIWIGQMLSRGVRKPTKNYMSRVLPLPPAIQELLLRRRDEAAPLADLVFPSPRGGAIDDHNFRNRAWTNCLKAAGVEYRKPYNTRSTFISHCLAKGMNPADIAELTGHDIETLYREYAGSIQSSPKVPDLGWD
ncbi:MAG: tyrosine-type recombinase/integrase [Cyanobacteria bacterium J06638_20]